MNHRTYRSLVNTQSKGYGADQHAHFIRCPALLVAPARLRVHLSVIGDGRDSALLQKVHCLLYSVYRGRVNDHVTAGVFAQRANQQVVLHPVFAFFDQILQVGTMEAGDVLVGIAQTKLRDDVMADLARRAGGKGGDRALGKVLTQRAELPVFGTKFVSPFGNAVRLVDGKKRNRNALQPVNGVLARKPLG